MNDKQRQYYWDMVNNNRGQIVTRHGHVVGIVTYFIGDDDDKFIYKHKAWDIVDDNPEGSTIYIDQLLVQEHDATGYIHREFNRFLHGIREEFPNVVRAKWVRVNATFRKHGLKEGARANVHCKNIRF